MKSALIILCLCIWSVRAYEWVCSSTSEEGLDLDDWCNVEEFSFYNLNDDIPPEKNLILNDFNMAHDLFLVRMEVFGNTEQLRLNGTNAMHDLMDVPPNLKNLSLSQFTELRFYRTRHFLHRLENLFLWNVSYQSLPVWSQFPALRGIYGIAMPQRSMNFSDFDGLRSLTNFSMTDGDLQTFSAAAIQDLPNLVVLNLRQNQLLATPDGINRLISLEEIDLSRNRITFVDMSTFSGLINLKRLDLSENSLVVSTMALVNLPALEFLEFDQCSLYELNVAYWSMPNLKILDVEHNHLRKITQVESAFVKNELMLMAGGNQWNCRWLEEHKSFLSYRATFYEWMEECTTVDGICCSSWVPRATMTIDEMLERAVYQMSQENYVLNRKLDKLIEKLDQSMVVRCDSFVDEE